jgi:hypothetical protein
MEKLNNNIKNAKDSWDDESSDSEDDMTLSKCEQWRYYDGYSSCSFCGKSNQPRIITTETKIVSCFNACQNMNNQESEIESVTELVSEVKINVESASEVKVESEVEVESAIEAEVEVESEAEVESEVESESESEDYDDNDDFYNDLEHYDKKLGLSSSCQ